MSTDSTQQDSAPLLVRACRGEETERAPIWLMRQAGRSLPEYQAIRAEHSFVEIATTPELATEVTLQPVRRLGVDAAIVFCDILLPLEPMGAGFKFDDKPVLEQPIRARGQVDAMRRPESQDVYSYLHEALRRIRKELPAEIALIGFAGAPFTLANYLIEGGGSDENLETRKLMANDPGIVHALLELLSEATIEYLGGQVEAGAQALQIFESSGVVLGEEGYTNFALPYAQRVIEGAKAYGVPIIFFPRGCGDYLERFADCGADVIGIDWQTEIGNARQRLGGKTGIQGNLDPAALLGTPDSIEEKAAKILDDVGDTRGFIFNLGHGVLPTTPPENAEALVRAVKRLSQRRAGE